MNESLLYPSKQWLTSQIEKRNIDENLSESQLQSKLEKLQKFFLQQDICQVQDHQLLPQKAKLIPYKFEDKKAVFNADNSEGGVLVQVQKLRNIGMPQKNMEEGDMPMSDEGEEDEMGNTQYKIEKFENKYLESADNSANSKRKFNKEQNRMFKFLLNDGKNETLAIELEKLYGITMDNCQVGSKIVLKGRIEVKRGIYLLRQDNISQTVWHNKEPGFKTVGNTSFNAVTESILNPKSLERKGLLQKRKTREGEKEEEIKMETNKQFKERMQDIMMNSKDKNDGIFEYNDQDYL